MADYKCLECGEEFENEFQTVKHHQEIRHENFEMLGSEIKRKVKILG